MTFRLIIIDTFIGLTLNQKWRRCKKVFFFFSVNKKIIFHGILLHLNEWCNSYLTLFSLATLSLFWGVIVPLASWTAAIRDETFFLKMLNNLDKILGLCQNALWSETLLIGCWSLLSTYKYSTLGSLRYHTPVAWRNNYPPKYIQLIILFS